MLLGLQVVVLTGVIALVLRADLRAGGVDGTADLEADAGAVLPALIAAAIGLTILLAVSVAVGRWITRPLAQLTLAIVEPERSPSTPPSGPTEIAALASALEESCGRSRGTCAQLEDALHAERGTNAALREVIALEGTFLEAVSAELRAPLTSVVGFLTVLAERRSQLGEERVDEILHRLRQQAGRLDSAVRDLSDLSTIGRRPRLRQVDPVDLSVACRAGIERVDAPDHDVLCDACNVEAAVDPTHVARIVESLVRDAVADTPPGTRVMVGLVPEATGGVRLEVGDDGGRSVQMVKDRLAGPARPRTSPSGLEMTLVVMLASLNGGTVEVGASPAGGARVTVRFSAARAEAGLADAPHGNTTGLA